VPALARGGSGHDVTVLTHSSAALFIRAKHFRNTPPVPSPAEETGSSERRRYETKAAHGGGSRRRAVGPSGEPRIRPGGGFRCSAVAGRQPLGDDRRGP